MFVIEHPIKASLVKHEVGSAWCLLTIGWVCLVQRVMWVRGCLSHHSIYFHHDTTTLHVSFVWSYFTWGPAKPISDQQEKEEQHVAIQTPKQKQCCWFMLCRITYLFSRLTSSLACRASILKLLYGTQRYVRASAIVLVYHFIWCDETTRRPSFLLLYSLSLLPNANLT